MIDLKMRYVGGVGVSFLYNQIVSHFFAYVDSYYQF
jgi:hypothetical protein